MHPDIRRIIDRLDRIKTFPDLTDEGIGEELCKIATDGVQESLARESDPTGNRWDELSAAYEKAKRRTHPGRPMGVREGLMTEPDEVAGEPEVTRDLATVTYGKSEQAKQEAAWFSRDRPFFGLTDEARARIRKRLEERLRDKVDG